jgi:hypothetical protein
MGVLRAVIEIAVLPVFDTGQALPLCRPITFEFIGDEHPWDVLASFEELAEELLRRLLIAPTLHEDIEDSAVLIHSPPQIVTFLVDRDEHLIEMPLVAWPRTPATELIRIRLPELPTPLTDGFVRHDDPTNEQEFFHIPVAEREAEIEPDGMVDNLTGEPMMLVRIRRR